MPPRKGGRPPKGPGGKKSKTTNVPPEEEQEETVGDPPPSPPIDETGRDQDTMDEDDISLSRLGRRPELDAGVVVEEVEIDDGAFAEDEEDDEIAALRLASQLALPSTPSQTASTSEPIAVASTSQQGATRANTRQAGAAAGPSARTEDDYTGILEGQNFPDPIVPPGGRLRLKGRTGAKFLSLREYPTEPASTKKTTTPNVIQVDRQGHRDPQDPTAPFLFYGPVRRVPDGRLFQTQLRGSAMMNARCIKSAFGSGKMDMRFAMQRATIPPYDRQSRMPVEALVVMATLATVGQLDLVPFDPTEHLWWVVGQAVAVGLPDEMFMSEETSNTMVKKGTIKYLKGFDANRRLEISKRVPTAQKWYTTGHEDDMPLSGVLIVVEVLIATPNANDRILVMNAYVGIFLAYTKQGQVTAAKLRKVLDGTNEGLVQLTLTIDQVRSLWDKYGPYFDDVSARSFFPRWEKWFRGLNLRMTLTILQSAYTGLTCLTLAKNVILKHTAFPWEQIAAAFPAAWTAYSEALIEVDDDPYYGYKKDLQAVAVANYIPIAYTAIKIQREVDGDMNLGGLLSLTKGNIQNQPFLDRLVNNYKDHHAADGARDEAAVNRLFTILGKARPAERTPMIPNQVSQMTAVLASIQAEQARTAALLQMAPRVHPQPAPVIVRLPGAAPEPPADNQEDVQQPPDAQAPV
uniref:Nucleoprotein n=1 Tax=Xining Chuvi tick virus 1 TaxID=2972093 RepID=A0A9E7V252_9VIRU|nr:MAG: putative nucleoprotein [Xining Chuvi tick virus 1]